jgi:hypothetical protein
MTVTVSVTERPPTSIVTFTLWRPRETLRPTG